MPGRHTECAYYTGEGCQGEGLIGEVESVDVSRVAVEGNVADANEVVASAWSFQRENRIGADIVRCDVGDGFCLLKLGVVA